jgi:uncharacterized protein
MFTKSFSTEIKANVDKRELEGYAAIFDDLDSDKDVIIKGAFKSSLMSDDERRRVKVLWQHNRSEPIGRPYELGEDSKGLYFRARLTKGVQRADETLALVADGVIDEMSFGFDVIESEMGEVKGKGGEPARARFLKGLRLWEISPVTWGANGNTAVSAAKALEDAVEVVKAGRVLSKRNLEALMSALDNYEAATNALRAVVDAAMGKEEDAKEPEATGEKKGAHWALDVAASRLETLIKNHGAQNER